MINSFSPVVPALSRRKLICAICVICGLICGAARALEIVNSTNTPGTNSAALYADLTNVTITTTATCYYGTTDGLTNSAYWAYATNYYDATNGQISVEVTNLTGATYYFYRWYAADGSTNAAAWSAASSNFTTLSRPPTNYPTPSTGVTVIADADTGALLSPVGFFTASGVPDSNTLAELQGAISTNTGNITTNAADILTLSGRVDNAEGAISTNTGNIATNAADILTLSGRVDNAAGAISTNTGNIATNTAALAALNSNLSYQAFATWLTDDEGTATVAYAHGSLVAIVVTNEAGITIAFDNADYPTNGVNRVGIELWAGTNSVAFDNATITNAVAPTIHTNRWTSLFFRRVTTNLWYGRQ